MMARLHQCQSSEPDPSSLSGGFALSLNRLAEATVSASASVSTLRIDILH